MGQQRRDGVGAVRGGEHRDIRGGEERRAQRERRPGGIRARQHGRRRILDVLDDQVVPGTGGQTAHEGEHGRPGEAAPRDHCASLTSCTH
jgi:hypothetical protein